MSCPNRTAVLLILALLTAILLSACDLNAYTPVAVTPAILATPIPTPLTLPPTTTITATVSRDIRIGLIGPFTGPSAGFGTALKRGAMLAMEDINSAGGINGRKISFVERDDKGSPSEGATIVQDLVDKEKVVALFGTATNDVGLAEAPLVQQNKVPWITPLATGTQITQEAGQPSYIFRDSMVDQSQAQFIAAYAASKYSKVAIIHDDNAYYGELGQVDLVAQFGLQQFGGVVLNETYQNEATADELKTLVGKIKVAAPQVIIFWGTGGAAATLIKTLATADLTIPIIGPWGLSQPDLYRGGEGAETGTLVAQTFIVDSNNNLKQQNLVNRYRAEFKAEMDFPSGVAQAYDAMRMLGEALEQPNADTNRSILRNALENLPAFDGVVKQYQKPFANQYHEALSKNDFFLAVWRNSKLYRYTT